MDSGEDDKERRQMLCLDTESSICLSFDKSLYDNTLPLVEAHRRANGTVPSSDSHLIPRVHEINGSSSSQQKFGDANKSDAPSVSSNDQSMATADMALSDAEQPPQRARDNDDDFDMELQEAVDLMLQGSTSPGIRPHRAYYMGNRPLVAALEPPNVFGAPGIDGTAEDPRPGLPRRVLERSKLLGVALGTKIAGRFKRRGDSNEPENDLDSSTTVDSQREETKRMIDDSVSDEINEKQGKCVECMPPPDTSAAVPSRMTRIMAPMVRYMQRRPMATLGIVLGVLVALLVVIIIILIVGVFPFLIRSTLQDVSLVVTSVHANAPPTVSRALHISKPSTHGLHKRDVPVSGHHSSAPWVTRSLAMRESTGHALESLAHRPEAIPTHLVPMHTAHHVPAGIAVHDSAHTLNAPGHMGNRVAGPPRPPMANRDEDVVTVTQMSVSTVHIAPPLTLPTPTPSTTSDQGFGTKALDSNAPPLTYSMQLGGNLTSGGPIGIDIEFTEPLRMYWRDIEVGAIEKPDRIHVPGRGTTQWSWPSFEVSVSQVPTFDGISNKKLEIPHSRAPTHPGSSDQGAVAAQRRILGSTWALGRAAAEGSTGAQDNLADWFAAIREHRSFTMQWKSQVRVSAMGMHTSNVKFEKTVRITCGGSKDCVISG
ncbi:hypothetical protein H4S02_001229 [Coemansia sp. RSA 2611]|nr:hypothetical protein H4S02_001229 [Coemansia sp. RSA 2611]